MGLFRKKKPMDIVAHCEASMLKMCTLAPQISEWQNQLIEHAEKVEQQGSRVFVGIKRLDGTKEELENLGTSVNNDREVLANARDKVMNIINSANPVVDPIAVDNIGVHEVAVSKLQESHGQSLNIVVATLDDEIDSMNSRCNRIDDELEGVTSKRDRLNQVKKALDKEGKVTDAFQENIGAFIISKIKPPKA